MAVTRLRIPRLVLATALPLLLSGAWLYSRHAIDRLMWMRPSAHFSAMLLDGTIQFQATQMPHVVVHSDWHSTFVAGPLSFAHVRTPDPWAYAIGMLLGDFDDDDIPNFHAQQQWGLIAYGSWSRYFDRRAWPPPWGVTPPSTVARYLQLPLWPWIALTALPALWRWWRFFKAPRRGGAFPVEMPPASTSTPA